MCLLPFFLYTRKERKCKRRKGRLRLKNNLVTGDWKEKSHLHASRGRGKSSFVQDCRQLRAKSAADDKRSSFQSRSPFQGKNPLRPNSQRILLRTTRGAAYFATNSAADDESQIHNEFCCRRREEQPTSQQILLRTTRLRNEFCCGRREEQFSD